MGEKSYACRKPPDSPILRDLGVDQMFKHFGRLAEKLKPVKIGFLELGPLRPGEFRYLTARGSRAVP